MGANETAIRAAGVMPDEDGPDKQEGPESPVPALDLSGLTMGQRQALKNVPDSLKPVFLRAYRGSRAAGIKAFCLSCVGYVKRDITGCTARGCPLFTNRPYQRDEREE